MAAPLSYLMKATTVWGNIKLWLLCVMVAQSVGLLGGEAESCYQIRAIYKYFFLNLKFEMNVTATDNSRYVPAIGVFIIIP